jgi:hypothetical protein
MLRICAAIGLVAIAALAQGPDPIRSLITEINEARSRSDTRAFSRLFTVDGDLRLGNKIVAIGPSAIEHALRRRAVWSETTPPIIGNESLRLVLSDLAIIDADQTQYGSLILKQRTQVTLLLKRDGASWRIFSLQIGRQ